MIDALTIWPVNLGFGKHLFAVPFANFNSIAAGIFFGEYAMLASLCFARHSALFFYNRIFVTKQATRFRYVLWILHGMNTLWLVGMVIAQTLICSPPSKFWNLEKPGTCKPITPTWTANASSSAALDLFVLVAPLPMVFRLKLKRSMKLLVAGLLVCGAAVFVVSLGRLISTRVNNFLSDLTDATYTGIPVAYWAISEPFTAVISISLPNLFHLVRRAVQVGPTGLVSRKTQSEKKRLISTPRRAETRDAGFQSIDSDPELGAAPAQATVEAKPPLYNKPLPEVVQVPRVYLRDGQVLEIPRIFYKDGQVYEMPPNSF